MMLRKAALFTLMVLGATGSVWAQTERPRARDLGVRVGIFEPGAFNAITDVPGVLVGHTTLSRGDDVRTGVTAIRPHGGNVYGSRVPAAIHVGNGFGKLLGVTQVRELGELETPILLTCTLCVWKAADAMTAWALGQEGMESVRSINPVVGETNDGGLNDIRNRPITAEDVVSALDGAASGMVEEGSVGAGTGTAAFGWKGGIGTSSRVLPEGLPVSGFTVGVLVQSNFGGILDIVGAPVGIELDQYAFRPRGEPREVSDGQGSETGIASGMRSTEDDRFVPDPAGNALRRTEERDGEPQGSIMMVVATDAPLSERNLERIARRAIMGLARTGSFASNGSGDYVIAFSTAESVRRQPGDMRRAGEEMGNDAMSALFQATVEATQEAIYNSLFKATTVESRFGTREALPIDETVAILRKYGVIPE